MSDRHDHHQPLLTAEEMTALARLASSTCPSEWGDAGRAADIMRAATEAILPQPESVEWFIRRFRTPAAKTDATPASLVAGDQLGTSIAEFVHKCEVHLEREQSRALPDNALIALLCDAVRLAREHVSLQRMGLELRDPLLDEGVRAVSAMLYRPPAHGHLKTPAEIERDRVAVDQWLAACRRQRIGG